jgi:hypothetical protein
VLTNGPRGPVGEGVGEEVRDAVTRKAVVLVGEAERRRGEGEAREAGGHSRARLPRVRLLLTGGSGFAAGGAALGAFVLLLLFPPSPSPPACGCVGRGSNLPRWLWLGELWGLRQQPLIAADSTGVRGQQGCAGWLRGAS